MMITEHTKRLIEKSIQNSFRLEGKPLPCPQVEAQQVRMWLYETLIDMASCDEEKKSLKASYEISRLIHIKHEDVIERNSWLLKDKK